MEAQSFSLTLEDRVSVEYITKHIASVQQVLLTVPLLADALCLLTTLSVQTAVHAEWWREAVRDIDTHLWFRPRW
jgi:hypothetical protein